MAAAAGKRSVKPLKDDLFLYDTPEIFQGYAPTKNPVSQPLSTRTKAKTKPKSSKSVKGSLLDSVLSEFDCVQDVLDREDRIRELEGETKMRQLTLQKLDKPLHPAKPPQFSSVHGPAAYQESSPIMFVNDPTHGMSQKGYKDLTLAEFIYGYIFHLFRAPSRNFTTVLFHSFA